MFAITQHDPGQHLDWLDKSCDYIRALYATEHAHTYKLDELAAGRFFLLHHGATAIGCGAIVPHGDLTIELRHFFIDGTARGAGGGKALLVHIEDVARQDGVAKILLETGDQQPAALGLYRAFGYHECEPYISAPLPHAVFMEKLLKKPSNIA